MRLEFVTFTVIVLYVISPQTSQFILDSIYIIYMLTPETYFQFPFLKTHNVMEMFLGVM